MPLSIPSGKFQAYIFDCDGTVADTMPLHYLAWKAELAQNGCPFPEDLFYSLAGTPTNRIVELLNKKYHLHLSPEEVASKKEERFFKLLDQVKPVPEVLDFIENLRKMNPQVPMAIASGGNHESVTKILKALGILSYFKTLVCAEDYTNGKPDPEVFLLAAERLGYPPPDCLVFEDAELGFRAAQAAGMKWVEVPGPSGRN